MGHPVLNVRCLGSLYARCHSVTPETLEDLGKLVFPTSSGVFKGEKIYPPQSMLSFDKNQFKHNETLVAIQSVQVDTKKLKDIWLPFPNIFCTARFQDVMPFGFLLYKYV